MQAYIRQRFYGAGAVLLIRGGGRALSAAAAILLARVLGVHGYGTYAYAIAWVAALKIPSVLGLDRLLIRLVAIYTVRETYNRLRGLVSMSDMLVAGFATCLLLTAEALAVATATGETERTLIAALPLVLFLSLVILRGAVLQGLHHPDLGLVPMLVVYPTMTIALVGGGALAGVELTPATAGALTVIASIAGLACGHVLRGLYLKPLIDQSTALYTPRAWLRQVKPFAIMSSLNAIQPQIGLIALGLLATSRDVGVFQAAARAADLVFLVFLGFDTPLNPQVAAIDESGNLQQLQTRVKRVSTLSLLYSIPLATALILAQELVFRLFGSGFDGGGSAMSILLLAQLINAATGSSASILEMTGKPVITSWAIGLGLILDVSMCIMLIPSLGLLGAAIARAGNVVLTNLAMAIIVYRRLGINATALPWPRSVVPE